MKISCSVGETSTLAKSLLTHLQPLLCPFLLNPLHSFHPSSPLSLHFQAFSSLLKHSVTISVQSPNSCSNSECPSPPLSSYSLIWPVHLYAAMPLSLCSIPLWSHRSRFCSRDEGLAVWGKGWAVSVLLGLVVDSEGLGFPPHYCFSDHCLLTVISH